MTMRIREFDSGDYEAVVEVSNRVYVEYPETADEWRHNDEHRDPKCRWQRFVAQDGGAIVGFAYYGHAPYMFHPQKLWLDVTVDPQKQRQGIGAALFEHLLAETARFEPIKYWAGTRQDFEASRSFLARRGFHEVMRAWESRLFTEGFEAGEFEGRIEAVESQGIRLATYAELADEPDHDRKLFELVDTVGRDVPSPDQHTPQSYEVWLDRTKTNPNFMPEAYFIALDGDKYVALSNLWRSQASPQEIYTGLTGTLPEYRRRGIAVALKLRGIDHAIRHGYKVLKTWNESRNVGMLAINERLGFVRQPAWIDYEKVLKSEG